LNANTNKNPFIHKDEEKSAIEHQIEHSVYAVKLALFSSVVIAGAFFFYVVFFK